MDKTNRLMLLPLLGALLIAGCGDSAPADGPKVGGTASSGGTVNAAGSTFIQPFLSKAFDEYSKKSGFQINYTGGGSSQGIQTVSDGINPFGASDAPMNDEELAKAKGKILNLPLVAGSVAIVYNVPGIDTNGLKLDGPVLADIFMGKIAKWNDPRLAALNAGLALRDAPITVQVRADGSGTTYVLSDFLSQVSADWKSAMGVNKKLKWSAANVQQWPKSDGVANNTKSTPGSISYVELSWAQKSGLHYAAVKNSAGSFVLPEAAGVTAAAASAKMPADFRVSIVNAPGAEAYPISTYSFGLVPEDLTARSEGRQIVDALKYVVGDAQQYAEGLGYAKLPDSVVKAVTAALDSVKTK